MRNRGRIRYFALALLFAISLGYRIREILDRVDLLVYPGDHVRDPFNIALPGIEVTGVTPEAEAAGIAAGDLLVAVAGRPYRGAVDFYTPVRKARPGDRIDVTVRSSGLIKNASIELGPYRNTSVSRAETAQQIVFNIMPVFCILLGFWVAAVRIFDARAWIFLVMMIAFAEINGGLVRSWFGHDDFFQPIGAAYQLFGANLLGGSMLFFGLYFPERFKIDRRWPWLKWLLVAPILVRAVQHAVMIVLAGKNPDAALMVDDLWHPSENRMLLLHMLAIGCFFALLWHKSFVARSRDARRRMVLLRAGASISMGPMFIVIVGNLVRFRPPLEQSLWFTIGVFGMVVGFPLTMAYVIVVERAMDVRVVIRQGIQYLLASKGVVFLQILLSALVIFSAASLSVDGMNRPQRIRVIALGIMAVALIQLFAKRVRAWIDRRFFREAYNAEQILSDLAQKVRTMVETRPLLETLADRISKSLHVPRVAVLINGGNEFQVAYALGYLGTPDVTIATDNPHPEKIAKEELEAELVLPLAVNQKVLGILSLGPKRSEEPYSKADMRLLGSVATQTGLALENTRLAEEVAAEVAQRERINREIEIAREVQERLFPQNPPEIDGLDYAGYCRPASGVGGDYYDFLSLPDGSLGIAIGDVSGKGIPAALLMASLRASLRGQTIQGVSDLATLMSNVNKLIYESSPSNRYATFFYAQYDAVARNLTYVNAGHNPPLVFRKPYDVLRLETGGPVVGLLPMSGYEQSTIVLEPGDMLVAFTDGISEAMDLGNGEWGEEGLIAAAWKLYGTGAQQTMHQLIVAADKFASGARQHDDMTLIVANVL
jgi:phosphoserine phosphatase RsbU/P